MHQFKSFGTICAYAVGAIGGVGTALASGSYFIAACVALLALMAFPKVRETYKDLMGE